ncbi:glycosyltransferase [Candidatus Roizmanbacteria bacterium CG_4_10_14_0_8_um_filter_39_9]|uniref:Glycosyltransferase n=1 Tax=Candidatus Roizmanbacteria bacterium CG_4_10_14_0_8_um_filter_39_9 TaxID=1974829 RepID=A0A2M7QBU2_9BACT|nr:MAG: glycosyltransferase [Candidatus Roizmanbacteria bacterium CG_4_10_14_0_8_um_filter_39_9]
MKPFLLSIIIPVYNEEGNILPLLERLLPIVKTLSYEIVFVEDGSKDRTFDIIKKEALHNPHIKLVSFLRNFGHQMALTAGYAHAKGDCVISMDADLQDPPEIILEMINKWQKGSKIVYAKRKERDVDSAFKKTTASLFYRFINFLSETPIPQEVGDFRLLDKEVVDFLNSLPEHSRFLRGLVAWGGFHAEYVYYNREKRFAGETHYPFSKMLNFALDGITTFSTKPLRIASYFGFVSATVGFLGILYALIGKIFQPTFFPHDWVTGWTGLFVGIMFMGGVQLITIGIIGEYISKIYKEVQSRPKYLIQEKINL